MRRWTGSTLTSIHVFYENESCKLLFDDIDLGKFEITEDKKLKINMAWVTKNLEWDSNSLSTRKGWYFKSDECLIIEEIELQRQSN